MEFTCPVTDILNIINIVPPHWSPIHSLHLPINSSPKDMETNSHLHFIVEKVAMNIIQILLFLSGVKFH